MDKMSSVQHPVLARTQIQIQFSTWVNKYLINESEKWTDYTESPLSLTEVFAFSCGLSLQKITKITFGAINTIKWDRDQ